MNIGNLLTVAGSKVESSVSTKTTAWSPKLFWRQNVLVDRAFEPTCFLLAYLKDRLEVLCIRESRRITAIVSQFYCFT